MLLNVARLFAHRHTILKGDVEVNKLFGLVNVSGLEFGLDVIGQAASVFEATMPYRSIVGVLRQGQDLPIGMLELDYL